MARPLDPAKIDHAIELYLAGKSIQEIQATAGVSASRLHRERLSRGIPSRFERELPMGEVIKAYQSGASELALSRQYDISRGALTKRLIAAGVQRRGTSEAGAVRAAQMTPEERKAQAAEAHRAARLRRVPEINKLRRALAVETEGDPDSAGEVTFYNLLAERLPDRPLIPQRAIGPYNVDMAMLPVAVEILGGGWHASKAGHAERIPYILDAGWHLVMVWDYEPASALGSGGADYVVAFLKQIRRNPPATCQYRVITGEGEVLAARGREDDEFPVVPPSRRRRVAGA